MDAKRILEDARQAAIAYVRSQPDRTYWLGTPEQVIEFLAKVPAKTQSRFSKKLGTFRFPRQMTNPDMSLARVMVNTRMAPDEATLTNTARHEFAHAVQWAFYGTQDCKTYPHGVKWIEIAIALGANPASHCDLREYPKGYYVSIGCDCRKQTVKHTTANKIKKHPERYSCRVCKSGFHIVEELSVKVL